jgi:hypothetical protein
MAEPDEIVSPAAALQCDCGYLCQGETIDERVQDGQRHAARAHGIDVTAEQILNRQAPE